MPEDATQHTLPTIQTGEDGRSFWTDLNWPIEARGGMLLSPRIDCSSLRLRQSGPGYATDWHVAGDPVLIVIRQGVLRIVLQDGTTRDFDKGQAFIAADALPDGHDFDANHHGHRAEVVGEAALEAIHIKLTASPG